MAADALTRRPADAADHDFLYQLHVATMREYVAQTWGWDEGVQQRMFRERFDPAKIEIIERQGRPVGMWSVTDEEDHIFLRSLEVDPAYQRRGVGTALIAQLLARADSTSRPVRLQVLKANPARSLYERLNFKVVGETPTHYVMQREPTVKKPQGSANSGTR